MLILETLLVAQSLILPDYMHTYISPTSTEIKTNTTCPTTGDMSIIVKSESGKALVTSVKSKHRSSSSSDLSTINSNLLNITKIITVDVGCESSGDFYIGMRGVYHVNEEYYNVRVLFTWGQTGAKHFYLDRDTWR